MTRTIALAVASLVLTASVWAVPSPDRWARSAGPGGCAGSWIVTFENGVIENCDIDSGGAAVEKEALRSGKGQAELQGRSFVIKFDDDRVERWTPINGRVVVEHWCPASQFPEGPRVLGIAERVR